MKFIAAYGKTILSGCFALSFFSLQADEQWFSEELYGNWKQTFKVSKVIYEGKSDCEQLLIFENPLFGRMLALDGIVQQTEADDFMYHEMMTHVPLLAHGNVRDVLIIGGGDGGILQEVVRHKNVDNITLVEIDPEVIKFSQKHLPFFSNGAFEDPRVQVVIQDGCLFVKEARGKFDVIICDSTDPIGPGVVLYTEQFYSDCKKALKPNGIFVNMNGVPFAQGEIVQMTYRNRKAHFKDTGYYLTAVPTYVGGFLAIGWATDGDYRKVPLEEIEKRLKNVQGQMRYYNPAVHQAAFALPEYVKKLMVDS